VSVPALASPFAPELDLAAFHAGQEAVIHQMYVDHGATLLRQAGRYTGDAEAEAIVHDVFVELLRNGELRRRFTGGLMSAWLRQITRLKSLEYLRRHGRTAPPEIVEEPSSLEGTLEARDVLTRFVRQFVPANQHQFFRLRFLERRTQVEVAQQLGIPRSTLEGWESRLTEKLRTFVLETGSW